MEQVCYGDFLWSDYQPRYIKVEAQVTHIPRQELVFAEDDLVHSQFRGQLGRCLCEYGLVDGETAAPGLIIP
jgi:hypothetical protein